MIQKSSISINKGEIPISFPPAWAERWGDDEYGLYADMVFRAEEFGTLNASEKKPFQKTSGESKQLSGGEATQRFRWIAAGDFLMGSPKDEPERFDREQQHKVTLTQGYWLADTTVTQVLWKLVVGDNPAKFKDAPTYPVERVSWNDSQNFIATINQKLSDFFGDSVLRLPTEAEWEHACRAGTTTPLFFGESVTSDQVNFNGSHPDNYWNKSKNREKTISVKSLPPNSWGLYEMHGNVWEWCADIWQDRLGMQPMFDPYHNYGTNSSYVMRGGSWASRCSDLRSAYRSFYRPDSRRSYIGFRLALGDDLKVQSAT